MKKRYSGPQIVAKLRQADVFIGQGKAVPEVCKEIEISQQIYYHWRQKYGGMSPDIITHATGYSKGKCSTAHGRILTLKT
jgi:putative transposase